MRLIDADALKESMNYNGGCGICFRYIDDADTVDAVPVVHARWIEYPECLGYTGAYSEHHIVCSECHDVWNIMDNDVDKFDFCPHCGADMRVNE